MASSHNNVVHLQAGLGKSELVDIRAMWAFKVWTQSPYLQKILNCTNDPQ